uniref:Uncharacterized protein n=1 Tax=Terrapene triunguis TaxID=2587831 RepID=A0A674K347_9SAUR
RRVHTFGKRENSIKRDPNAPVVIRGWLCKQVPAPQPARQGAPWGVEGGSSRLPQPCPAPAGGAVGSRAGSGSPLIPPSFWGPPDSREEAVLGSIPLPSYEIRPLPGEGKSRRFTFKVSPGGVGLVRAPPQVAHSGSPTWRHLDAWVLFPSSGRGVGAGG